MSKLLAIRDTANYYLYRKPVKMSRSFDGLAVVIVAESNCWVAIRHSDRSRTVELLIG